MYDLAPPPAEIRQQFPGPRRGTPGMTVLTAAETTSTPGLVVNPELRRSLAGVWEFTGTWAVSHHDSGQKVIGRMGAVNLGHARDLAVLLGELNVDWTQSAARIPVRDPELRAAIDGLSTRARNAAEHGRPIRIRRSWHEVAPPYWIGTGNGHADEGFDSFTEAADFLLRLVADEPAIGFDYAVIGRDTAAWWELRCAATDCRAQPSEGEDSTRPRRSELAELARDEHWRYVDPRHWLCARCSSHFASIHP